MSQSSDYATLFDVETQVETAWKTLLTDGGRAAYMQREYEDLPDRRVDIQLSLGGATGHRHADLAGNYWLDAWTFRLVLSVVTPQGATAGLHAADVAAIAAAAQYASARFDEADLPYHTLTQIQQADIQPSVRGGDDSDVSEISFAGVVSIRANAWPAIGDTVVIVDDFGTYVTDDAGTVVTH